MEVLAVTILCVSPIFSVLRWTESLSYTEGQPVLDYGNGICRMVIGSRRHGNDVVLLYKSPDFLHWTLNELPLYEVSGRKGMWEVSRTAGP